MSSRSVGFWFAVWLGGCAAEPKPPSAFGDGPVHCELEVLGDGFVRTGKRRIPLEAAVLELRFAARELPPAEVKAWLVQVRVAKDAGPAAADDCQRLLRELEILGIKQLRLL